MAPARGLRAIAIMEAVKGAVAIVLGFVMLALADRDAEQLAVQVIDRAGANPADRLPRLLMDAGAALNNLPVDLVAAIAIAYGTVRFVEVYGLWNERSWAEWFSAISGAIYIPFELIEIGRGPSGLNVGALVLNVIIVGYLAQRIARRRNLPPQPFAS